MDTLKQRGGVSFQKIDIWEPPDDYEKQITIQGLHGGLIVPGRDYEMHARLRDNDAPWAESFLWQQKLTPNSGDRDQIVNFSVPGEVLFSFFTDHYTRRAHLELLWRDMEDGRAGVFLWLIRVNQRLS